MTTMENPKILKGHNRQLFFLRLLAKVGIHSPLGKLIRLVAYFLDLSVLGSEWRNYLETRQNLSKKFLGLDLALIHTSFLDAQKLIETVPQKRDNYLGPLKINARSFFLGNTLSLGINGKEHTDVRELFLQILGDSEQNTSILGELVEQALERVAQQQRFNVKDDIPRLMVELLHKYIFELQLSDQEIYRSVDYINNLALATVPNSIHTTILSSKTAPLIQHRRELLEKYKTSPKYQQYLEMAAFSQLNEERVTNQLFDMIHIAGTAGTSALLGSVFGVLSSDQGVQTRVVAELDSIWDGKATPNAQLLEQLEITEKVIFETARLYPPVRFVSQLATEPQEIEIAGKQCPIQTGSRLIASIFTANRDPDKYDHPNEFRLTRNYSDLLSWNGDNQERKCPGRSLSITLIKLFCLYAFKRYQWTSCSTAEWDMNRFGQFTPQNLVFNGFTRRVI